MQISASVDLLYVCNDLNFTYATAMRIVLLAILSVTVSCHWFQWPDKNSFSYIESSANADRVTFLPGLTRQPSFAHFSGYLKGSTENFQLHYWFLEAVEKPDQAPLVLWLNGGPGCSSLGGLLTENGPFMVQDGQKLIPNPYSWNKFANVLYLEAPAGVGYSYAKDGNVTTDDDLTSLNSYHALIHFMEKFPAYKNRDLFICGESYAGVYVPTLALRILQNSAEVFNLKGIAIGNGLVNRKLNDNSLICFVNYHGLVDESLWNEALNNCCDSQCDNKCMFTDDQDISCQETFKVLIQLYMVFNLSATICHNCHLRVAVTIVSVILVKSAEVKIDSIRNVLLGLNIYNLYTKCAGGVLENSARMRSVSVGKLKGFAKRPELANLFRKNVFVKEFADAYPELNRFVVPCVDDSRIVSYLNLPEVCKALHVDLDFLPEWELCSEAVYTNYGRTYEDLSKQYLHILEQKIPVMLFAGDVDMACNYLGILWFVDGLGLQLRKPMERWLFEDTDGTKQVGGIFKIMATAENTTLWYVTVRGSGHMVPEDKPAAAYSMITRFINGKEL
ncbi:cathepsin A (carboxypeptidase C) [Paragonimus westermani]|uniref:Carboxypeptidase n=1 Tax=Paragonimus westermani TaxID=34504 RepID=A0A5J4NFN2_9TREM|nr:cathepsin A (carboxypeptidase C) [Paragonimus westermani]